MGSIAQNKKGLKVLFIGAALQLVLGIIYVWSVFVTPVSQTYSWDLTAAKLTSSYMLCFFVVGILAGGRLQTKIASAKVVLLGGLMLAAGTLASAFIPAAQAWLIYLSYGIVGGFGVGAAYNAIISSAQKWFPANRGFATGISVCAFGFSTVIFAPLVEALVARFEVRTTFMILAAAFLVVVLALFRFIQLPGEAASPGAPASPGASAPTAPQKQRQFTITEALKTKEFYFITLSLMFGTATYFILNPSFKTFAVERGLDPAIGTALVMMTGVANALGRLGIPLISDKIGRERAALVAILATAGGAAALCFAQGALFMVFIAVIAFCYGGYSGIYPVLTADFFGIQNVGSNYGAVMAGFALSALVFPMIFSRIENVTVKFIVLALLAVVAALMVLRLAHGGKKA
ncbi:MAG: MFS transporter [Clostridiales bacterium]|jgi:OFA family oxalate/formate antiporter-like MFS transporter|nr:MFS transporter [Clostridiales bacterium]